MGTQLQLQRGTYLPANKFGRVNIYIFEGVNSVIFPFGYYDGATAEGVGINLK